MRELTVIVKSFRVRIERLARERNVLKCQLGNENDKEVRAMTKEEKQYVARHSSSWTVAISRSSFTSASSSGGMGMRRNESCASIRS